MWKLSKACTNVLSKGATTSIQDLLTLIKWRNGEVPADTTAANKDTIWEAWEKLQVSKELLQAEARAIIPAAAENDAESGDGPTPSATNAGKKPAGLAKPASKARRSTADSSDEEDDDEEDSDDDVDCEGESDEESSDEEEETYEVKAIHEERGKGATLQYRIEWEGYAEHTWEPPSVFLQGNVVLEAWLATKQAAAAAAAAKAAPKAPKKPAAAKPKATIAKNAKK